MKKHFTICMCFIACCIVTSCTGWLISFQTVTYDCDWSNDLNAIFTSVNLMLPYNDDESEEHRFQNLLLENVLNFQSIHNVMDNVGQGFCIGNSFDFKWTVTIMSGITCSPSTLSYSKVILNRDNYMTKFTSYDDMMEGTPHATAGSPVLPTDHKHELVFQIHDVENSYNGQVGTIAWKYTWFGPNGIGSDEWWFNFPEYGVIASFTPNRAYVQYRCIYHNGEYQNILISQ